MAFSPSIGAPDIRWVAASSRPVEKVSGEAIAGLGRWFRPFGMETTMKRRDFLGLAVQSTALLGLPLLNSRAVAATESALSAKHVTLCSSLGLTGILAGSATDISAGLQAAFRSANRSGGINGREIKLLTMDDGYVASRTADNAKEVIAAGSALAFLSGQGTPNHAAMLPITEQNGVPVVGPITGADSLRQEKF